MADKTIDQLTLATAINDNDLFVLQQSATAKKLLGSALKQYIDRNVLTVSVTQLPEGSTPTCSYNAQTGALTIGIPKGDTGDTGATGATGATGNGIASTVLNADYTLTITFTDGTSYTTPSIRGSKGDTGDTGANASVTETKYQASSSGTVIPTGEWLDSIPSVQGGHFLWTRYRWNNGTYAYLAARYGIDGQGAVSSVDNVAPDINGNVALNAYVKPSGGIPDADIASAATWNGKQSAISANGILKGDGQGGISAAAAGTDYAAAYHVHGASQISGGTLAGLIVANSSGETYSTYCLRNTRLASTDTSPTVNGEISWTYE